MIGAGNEEGLLLHSSLAYEFRTALKLVLKDLLLSHISIYQLKNHKNQFQERLMHFIISHLGLHVLCQQ